MTAVPKAVKAATTVLGWKHPHVGEQEELLCDEHLTAVRDALHTLGIGCIGSPPLSPSNCGRCGKSLPWRNYLHPDPPQDLEVV